MLIEVNPNRAYLKACQILMEQGRVEGLMRIAH